MSQGGVGVCEDQLPHHLQVALAIMGQDLSVQGVEGLLIAEPEAVDRVLGEAQCCQICSTVAGGSAIRVDHRWGEVGVGDLVRREGDPVVAERGNALWRKSPVQDSPRCHRGEAGPRAKDSPLERLPGLRWLGQGDDHRVIQRVGSQGWRQS